MPKLRIGWLFLIVVLAVSASGELLAKEKPRARRPAAARPALRLPQGTEVKLRTETLLSSKTAKVGDAFTLRVIDPVRYREKIVIPAGAMATGRVIEVKGRGMLGKSGTLKITAESVVVGKGSIRLRGAGTGAAAGGSGQTALKVAGAVVASPLVFLAPGRSAVIEAGTEFIAYTNEDY